MDQRLLVYSVITKRYGLSQTKLAATPADVNVKLRMMELVSQ